METLSYSPYVVLLFWLAGGLLNISIFYIEDIIPEVAKMYNSALYMYLPVTVTLLDYLT